MPTNLNELYTVLKTFKEKKNVIPLTGYEGLFGDIATTFGLVTTWKDVDGRLINVVEDPAMRDYLAFMNQLYKEGLIDSEWPINTGSKVIEKFTSGKAAMMRLGWWSAPATVNALEKNFPNAKIAIVPFLKDEEGKAAVAASSGITYYITIPKFSKNKEDAIKWMNLKLQSDIFKGLVIGQEGVHHNVKDGKYYPILPKFNEDLTNASYFLTGTDEKNYPTYWQARVRKDPVIQSYYEQYQENAKGIYVLDPLTFSVPLPNISKNIQKLTKFVEDNLVQFIAGTEPLDNYDDFLSEWRTQGGEDMLNDANAWYKDNK